MIIAILPAVVAIVSSFAALGPGARRAPAARATFAGLAAAIAALSLGILTDTFFAWEFFSGRVPFDAGSNQLFDLYHKSHFAATLVGTGAAVCVLLWSAVVAVLADKKSDQPSARACSVLSTLAIGTAVIALFAIRASGSLAIALLKDRAAPATVAEQLATYIQVAALAASSAVVISLGLYFFAFRARGARHRSTWNLVLTLVPAALLIAQTPSLVASLAALTKATTYSGYLPPP